MGRYADQPGPHRAVGDEPPPFDDGLSTGERNRVILTALSDQPEPAYELGAARGAWAAQYVTWAASNGLLTARETASYRRRGADAAVAISNDVQRRRSQQQGAQHAR